MSPVAQPSLDAMIQGGSPTIFITDMERAVRFYTESLGLSMLYRADDHFAMIDAGNGFHLGLHPAEPLVPEPGTRGSIQVGLNVSQPIENVVNALTQRGVVFQGPIVDDGAVKLAHFNDPDGNSLYLCEVKH